MNFIKVLAVVAIALNSFSARATWNLLGPDSIVAYNVCFNVDNMNNCIICTDDGFWIGDSQFSNWEHYHVKHLPVWDACYQSGFNILLAIGNGDNSDGIYIFNATTHDLYPLEQISMPHFICYQKNAGMYFTGYYGGLLYSDCGINWVTDPFFTGKNIVAMDFFGMNVITSEIDNLLNIFYSDDGGSTWNTSAPGSPMLGSITFDFTGKAFGIFPDQSWSSGLWSSEDSGATWSNEFYSIDMSAVGTDNAGNLFTGWAEDPSGTEEGVAMYNEMNGELTFLNDGLPDLGINKIKQNPAMSAIVVFCCTNAGVYYSYDYMTGIQENSISDNNKPEVYPNPFDNLLLINIPSDYKFKAYTIFDQKGNMVMKNEGNPALDEINKGISTQQLANGVYFLIIRCENRTFCRKIIKGR